MKLSDTLATVNLSGSLVIVTQGYYGNYDMNINRGKQLLMDVEMSIIVSFVQNCDLISDMDMFINSDY